ncbi:hypothetical protein AVEN_156476-1, partial [Araneus ventricosus]
TFTPRPIPPKAFLNPEEQFQTACHFPFRASKEKLSHPEISKQQWVLFTVTSSCSTPAITPQDPDGLPPTHPLPPTTAADYPISRTESIQHHQCTITGD